MSSRTRQAVLFFGVVVFLLQATLGFAASVGCIIQCAESAKPAALGTGHCGSDAKQTEDSPAGHKCNGTCQEIDTMDQAVPPTVAISVSWPVLDWPAIVPDSQDLRLPLSIGAPKFFAGDSSPPQSVALDHESARAPPVA